MFKKEGTFKSQCSTRTGTLKSSSQVVLVRVESARNRVVVRKLMLIGTLKVRSNSWPADFERRISYSR